MEAIEAILKRRSVRRYRPDPIPEEHLRRILECGRQSPSAGNRQPWHFVVTRDPDLKRRVAEACNGQTWMADADVILTGVGLPEVSRGSTGRLWYQVDVAIAMQNIILAATTLGYGTCWIGAFDEGEVKQVLRIPEELRVVALTPIGVPAESPGPRPRRASQEVFSRERFGGGWT
ncbi:MAG TPA: nitroreductase [Candidatus Latescibacteria bacterium]|nr:nitroreductase [Candidatus Latescibacterota bacterium]